MGDREPADYLRTYWPSVRVIVEHLPNGKRGETLWIPGEDPRIVISSDLDPFQYRATLCHEMLHLERGAPDADQRLAEEAHVRRQTARWLLPDVQHVGAMVKREGLAAAAFSLRVPSRVLVRRLREMTDQEAWLIHG